MRKLLAANLRRLWINKAFWISVIFTISMEALCCYLLLQQQDVPMDLLLFISLQGIGICSSVCISLFLGVEYGDGTIRNKLIIGHKRSSIYLASLFTCCVIMTSLYLSGILTAVGFGITSSVASQHNFVEIMIASVVGWLACISYGAIFNFIGLLSSNKARTSILMILTALLLLIVGILCYSLMMQNAFPEAYRSIVRFLLFYNPFGQTLMAMTMQTEISLELASYALSLIMIITGIGLYMFRKKDMK